MGTGKVILDSSDYGKFKIDCMNPQNPKWEQSINRYGALYTRDDDVRSEFYRDYTRLLHSEPFRRLKRKTQVFFAPQNDHLCTRIEHVNHVSSVSYTISNYLGLNTELSNAISIGHDIGHAPFGHAGETKVSQITEKYLGETFWHEKNGIIVADRIATLLDFKGYSRNLSLTYAVRDGIISHCGEVHPDSIRPRSTNIDLYQLNKANESEPFTWEGCVVKISDKISYLGRDIEDAISSRILHKDQFFELRRIVNKNVPHLKTINNTVLMHNLIVDLCKNSSIEQGLCFSKEFYALIKDVMAFNYKHIYSHPLIKDYAKYSELILETLFNFLYDFALKSDFPDNLKFERKSHPIVIGTYYEWLVKYSDYDPEKKSRIRNRNLKIYNLDEKKDRVRSIVDFISGMTDNFAIRTYQEIISF